MNIFGKNLDDSVIVVAEIGVNHEGNPKAAHRLLELAAEDYELLSQQENYDFDLEVERGRIFLRLGHVRLLLENPF